MIGLRRNIQWLLRTSLLHYLTQVALCLHLEQSGDHKVPLFSVPWLLGQQCPAAAPPLLQLRWCSSPSIGLLCAGPALALGLVPMLGLPYQLSLWATHPVSGG